MAEETTKPEVKELNMPMELLMLGHLAKYNLYLLSKSIVFSAVLSNSKSLTRDEAVEVTNRVMAALDTESSRKPVEEVHEANG